MMDMKSVEHKLWEVGVGMLESSKGGFTGVVMIDRRPSS